MAQKSERTKNVSKKALIFGLLSLMCFVGVALFSIIACLTRLGGSESSGMEIISEQLKTVLVSFSVTLGIVTVSAIVIKNKIRTTVYMLALVMNGILFKEVGMYIILAIWALDEFVFAALHKKFKALKIINKEIDIRG